MVKIYTGSRWRVRNPGANCSVRGRFYETPGERRAGPSGYRWSRLRRLTCGSGPKRSRQRKEVGSKISVNSKELIAALKAIEKEKGIELEILFEALEVALVSAYKRNFQAPGNVRVSVDRETGAIKVFSQLKGRYVMDAAAGRTLRPKDDSRQLGDFIEMSVPRSRRCSQPPNRSAIQRIRRGA